MHDAKNALSPTDPTDGSHPRRWQVLAVLCAGLFVVAIDVTVLYVAAPAISEELAPSATGLLWILDVYPLVVAPLLVAASSLGDRFGRKRLLLIGLALLGVGSLAAAFAWSTGALIAARALMGVGAAALMPSTMAILRDVFRDRQERRTAVGFWSAVLAIGSAIGPLLGGVVVAHWWWGGVFLIGVPVVLVALVLATRLLPESRSAEPPPWDSAAIAMVTFAVLAFAYAIKDGARHGFADPVTLALLAAAAIAGTAFVRRQLAARQPMLDVRLFGDRMFAVATGCVALSMFALIGLELFFAQYFQLVDGLDPLAASVRLLPLMIAACVGGLVAAPLLRRFDTRITITGGLGLTTLSLVPALAIGEDHSYLLLAPAFAVMGCAIEVALVGANDILISAVSPNRAGNAAAIEETAYQLGGGLGIAVLGSVLAAVYSHALAVPAGTAAGLRGAADESLGRAVEATGHLPPRLADALLESARSAFVSGLRAAIVVSIVLLAVSTVLAAVVLRPSRVAPAGAECASN
jgi:DHA2 family multidrug resistance protein-like MFS transporter